MRYACYCYGQRISQTQDLFDSSRPTRSTQIIVMQKNKMLLILYVLLLLYVTQK